MAAYLIVEHIITDAAKFDTYRTTVAPMIARHGGRYLTKGGSHKFPEGGHWKPERVVIIEFPDMASLDAWYNSPEYQPLIALRKECTSELDMLMTLEGVQVLAAKDQGRLQSVTLTGDYIELCQLLKLAGIAGSGGEGKQMVAGGEVNVDGRPESRKTAKIRAGQKVACRGITIVVSGAVDG